MTIQLKSVGGQIDHMVFAPVDPSIKEKVIESYLAGHGRNQIDRELREQGIKVSHGSISNIINAYNKRKHEQPPPSNDNNKNIGSRPSTAPRYSGVEENGYPVAPAKDAPLNWFMNGYETKSEVINASEEEVEKSIEGGNNSKYTPPTTTNVGSHSFIARSGVWNEPTTITKSSKDSDTELVESNPPRKIYPREPKYIEDRFELEGKTWDYYGAAQTRILERIAKEKERRRHELFLIDTRRKRLEQMQYDLTTREGRILESEPYLGLAKKLAGMKLTFEDALPWIETVEEVAQMYNMDSKQAAISVAEDIRLNKQLGGIQRQIEKANQELGLINMATMQKQQALTLLMDLSNRGVTESQIVQLIAFAGEWNKMMTTNGKNGNHQQSGSNDNNGHGSNFSTLSMNDLIRLNLLKSSTERATNMLNRMETTH